MSDLVPVNVKRDQRFGFTHWAGEMTAPPYTIFATGQIEICFVRWGGDWVAYYSPKHGVIPLVGIAKTAIDARNELLTESAKVIIEDMLHDEPRPLVVQLMKLFDFSIDESGE